MTADSADIHALSGAYALDALPDDERAFFERHLAVCDACREEVAELQETTALLAGGVAQAPPPGLRDAVLAAADVTRQLPPERPVQSPTASRSWLRSRILAPLAACLSIAVLALGATVVVLNERLEESRSRPDVTPLVSVLGAEDLQTVELDLGAAVPGRFMYSPDLDRGVLVAHGIADPGAHETYELWLIHDGTPVPAGLFRPDGSGAAVAHIDSTVRGAELVAVTIEPAGGSTEPTGAVLASASLS